MVNSEIEYRYELKYIITRQVADYLKYELGMLMPRDAHSISKEYSYLIRSIYFDNLDNDAYFEKVDGIEIRKKYRLRMYNNDKSFLRLECKHKDGNMTYKEDSSITYEDALKILDGDYWDVETEDEFLNRFLTEAKMKNLKPSVIVEYKRNAFVYPLSEVRITFDEELKSGRFSDDFFNEDIPTVPLYPQDQMVLEVKCNEYIPEHILSIFTNVPMLRQAVSKFALCTEVK